MAEPAASWRIRRDRSPVAALAPWAALGLAFSPVLVDLFRDLLERPQDRTVLLTPVLLVWAARRESRWRAPRPRRDGAVALIAGTVLEFVGILGGAWSLARLGFPIASLGLARWLGAPSVGVALLAFLAMPLPDSIATLGSPGFEKAFGGAAATALSAIGVPVQQSGQWLAATDARVELKPIDQGFVLAIVLAAIGWFAAVAWGEPIRKAALRAVGWAVIAAPIQLAALVVAGGLVAAGFPGAARAWLTHGVWTTTALLALAWLARRARRER